MFDFIGAVRLYGSVLGDAYFHFSVQSRLYGLRSTGPGKDLHCIHYWSGRVDTAHFHSFALRCRCRHMDLLSYIIDELLHTFCISALYQD